VRRVLDATLTTLEGRTPSERRKSLVEQVERLVRADFTAYLDLTPAHGKLYYDHVTCVGSRDVTEGWMAHAQGAESVSTWDPRAPSPELRNRFQPGADIDFRELAGTPVYDDHYLPFGLCRERRILIYHGDVFAGWLGVSRHEDAPPFTRGDMRRLRHATQRVINLVVAEKQLRDRALLHGSGMLVLRPSGRVELACESARAWLDAARREAIAHHVRRLEKDPAAPTVFVTDGVAARLLRISGDGRVRYLCSLEATRSPRLSPLGSLSARQREVAELLAVGATVQEIATHLGIGAATVKHHAKVAYRRLDVATRLELARVLDTDR
jgi:DNA-binding CsgD family transcriptional regulator